ncbi:hypothetical protein KSP40_PGU011403 [Platanthera guangdongensis]|uniref:Uncharacterized protein n=1 Tax=Platanthera guangdongensis TaxID=2320717 RepID=A0ABR2LZT2_9ASPA
MRETVLSYADIVHRVEAQIGVDEAIKAHRQQFEGSTKQRREPECTSNALTER